MTLKYKIQFYDYWHLGSGLSNGAKLDNLVIKDSDNFPYIPAKTIKGLVKEMATTLDNQDFINDCFGSSEVNMGRCYFTNGTLKDKTIKEIKKFNLQDNLYNSIASTKIDSNGIAVNGSLREIEVTIPLTLQGQVDDISENYIKEMKKSLKLIKRMGLNRNRGLGRCEFLDFEEIK
jgi:CRISPR/Cas system CSM-associated protein Csm3 (group 7 of RAMP superfamily)